MPLPMRGLLVRIYSFFIKDLIVILLPMLAAVSWAAERAIAQTAPAAAKAGDSAATAATSSTDVVRMSQAWASQNHFFLWLAYLSVASVVGTLLWRFSKTEAWANLRERLQHEMLGNWRLALLAITSLALTVASGWTTWDGMTNFTGTPVLSFLITLGIQGIMLIAAWLIGESFAVGLAASGGNGKELSLPDKILAVLSVILLAAAIYAVAMVALQRGTIEYIDSIIRRHKSELSLPIPTTNFRILIALGVTGLLTSLLVSQKEIFQPYLRGLKAILMSLPVWLMFMACMLTSVFFSFDSLFSTIFPASERERAAQLRTTNQVAGIVSDLGVTIAKRQADNTDTLFTSAEWKDYSLRLNDIITLARGAPEQIAALTRKELEDQQSTRAGLEERKATAQSQQVRLEQRKDVLLGDINKLKEEAPPIAAEVDRLKTDVFKRESEILTKKAEMQAEAGGVGGTLKAGQGPEWQKRRKELDDFATLKGITASQLKERAAQLKEKRDRIGAAESELAQIDGEIGKLRGEKDVADKQMASVSAEKPSGSIAASTQNIAVAGFASLDEAFAQFRQRPDRKTYDAVQQQCGALITVFDKVPALKADAAAKNVRCDPSIVAESVGRILALNDGLVAFKERCAKPDSLPQTGVDDLLKFGQQCVQSSGLDGKDTANYRAAMNGIGLNRDDKAHRFVVSWNAFLDGNRLAYLALAIAFALDGLVFMSGLFGANAVSSPLVRLPSAAQRSAADLEATMFAALRPDIYGSAKLVIDALHPISPRDGFVSEVRIGDYDRISAASIRRVLSAGAQFGGVEPDARRDGVFFVRGALTEFLAKACERELRTNPGVREAAEVARKVEAARHAEHELVRQAETDKLRVDETERHKEDRELERRARALEPVLTAALIPEDIEDKEPLFHASQRLLAQMQPTAAHKDFTSEIDLTHVDGTDRQFFRSVLNTAAARRAVERAPDAARELYFVRPELTLCLAAIRVRAYEDWQRRSRKKGAFSWLVRPRDVTPVQASLPAPGRPNLQVVKETGGATQQRASLDPLPVRVTTPQPSLARHPIDLGKARREGVQPSIVQSRAIVPDIDAQSAERVMFWAKRNAFSDVDMAWLRVLLNREQCATMSGYLAEMLAPSMIDSADAEARNELPSFRKAIEPMGVAPAEADILARALSALHQLQSLKEHLAATLVTQTSIGAMTPDRATYFATLGELHDSIRLFAGDAAAAHDIWPPAIDTLRQYDSEEGRRRLAT